LSIRLDAPKLLGGQYRAIVTLEDVEFQDGRGRSVKPRVPISIDAIVGWYAG
jgi:hypothetical protein